VIACAPALGARQRALTAEDLVVRIKEHVGVPWRATTVDGIKVGDPSTPITGIATTAIATVDVLRRAASARQNFVVTQEPVLYDASDGPAQRAADPIYLAKKKLIEDGRLVVYRLSDHWSARQPNESALRLAAAMHWTPDHAAAADQLYRVQETTLGALAAAIKSALSIRGGMRVVGQASMRVRSVFVSPETTTLQATIRSLPNADVIIAGEPREWEAVPYVLDTAAAGNPKGMIALGRVVSERMGMQACATWLKSFVPDVPVAAIDAADPYWSPLS
jgi:putative NIF3 family GTP cyclohydrolase 1 type 2